MVSLVLVSVLVIMFDVKIERWLKWVLSQFVERYQIGLLRCRTGRSSIETTSTAFELEKARSLYQDQLQLIDTLALSSQNHQSDEPSRSR